MAGQLSVRVITPDRIALDAVADSIQFPAVDGQMGILPRHAPMIAALGYGVLSFRSGGVDFVMFIAGGFAEVRNDTVRFVTQAGETAEQIDVARAREAERRARERLELARMSGRKDIDLIRAEAALQRALLRLRVRERI